MKRLTLIKAVKMKPPIFVRWMVFGSMSMLPAIISVAEDENELIKGNQFPSGFAVAVSSLSPDKRYGVLVPADWDHYRENVEQNKLVEVKTGRLLCVIRAETGMVQMNHGGILPSQWSADGSLLFWKVDGKRCPRALVLLKIDKGEVKWQRDILKVAQQEILARTRKAALQKFAAAKKRLGGTSGHYPDGFTVNVVAGDEEDAPLPLPLSIHAELESDPKPMEDGPPENAKLSSEMNAMVDLDGKLVVKDFHLG